MKFQTGKFYKQTSGDRQAIVFISGVVWSHKRQGYVCIAETSDGRPHYAPLDIEESQGWALSSEEGFTIVAPVVHTKASRVQQGNKPHPRTAREIISLARKTDPEMPEISGSTKVYATVPGWHWVTGFHQSLSAGALSVMRHCDPVPAFFWATTLDPEGVSSCDTDWCLSHCKLFTKQELISTYGKNPVSKIPSS